MDYYDLDSLSRALGMLEERYGLSSDEFFAAHCADNDQIVGSVPGFHRHLWASFYRDVQRMHGSDPQGSEFVAGVGRAMAAA